MTVLILIQPTGGYKLSGTPFLPPFLSEIMFPEKKTVRRALDAPLWLGSIKQSQGCPYNIP